MKKLRPIFLASFFFSIHLAFLAYLNASMLERYANESLVSIFYTVSAALSLVLVFLSAHIIKRAGLFRYTILLLCISALCLCILATNTNVTAVVPIFILYFSLNTLIVYLFDLYIEHYSKEHQTGNTRGLLLTLNSLGWVVSPIMSGFLTSSFNIQLPYTIAATMVTITLIIFLVTQRRFKDRAYAAINLRKTFRAIRASHPLRRIMTINFIMQFFFAWMVLYTPLYLSQIIGFSWVQIGIMLSIMLLPFALFQYPVGKMLDRVGERPFIISGLVIMSVATLGFAILGKSTFTLYAIALFFTRVGASMLEVATESYFFKQLNDKDASIIGMFRNMLPIAYIIAPMFGALLLFTTSYSTIFMILSVILLLASIYSFRLKNIAS